LKKYTIFKVAAAAWLLWLLVSLPAMAYTAKVIGVSDGDDITVLKSKTAIKIRLYGIDCPERGQTYGAKAKRLTSDMVSGKMVEIKAVDTDRYKRSVAWVTVAGKSLNEELVRAGLAWHYKRYSSDQVLAELERQARKSRVGLWADPHSIPPWEYRRLMKNLKKRGNQ
jgi:endonuclease YncB( thermonuclease family)